MLKFIGETAVSKKATRVVLRAYFAGLFDGEGSITTRRVVHSGHHFDIRLDIALKNGFEVLYEGQRLWGGQVYKRKNGQGTQFYNWCLYSKVAEQFLRDIFPYLRVKKDRISLALELRETKVFSGRIVPPGIMHRRQEIVDTIRLLNGRYALC